MKPRIKNLTCPLAMLAAGFAPHSTFADNATWNGTSDTSWATPANWSAPIPGSGNTATFDNAGNGNVVISLSGVTITGIAFNTANAAAYTLGSGAVGAETLTLEAFGLINMAADTGNNQLFNANLLLSTTSGSADFTFTNNSTTKTLTFAGAVSGTGTADAKVLTVNGDGATAISGNIGNGVGTVALKKDGIGTLSLSGTNVYAGSTTVSNGKLEITGGSITSDANFFGAVNANKPTTVMSGGSVTLTAVGGGGNRATVGQSNVGNPSSLVMSGTSSFTSAGNFSVGGNAGGTAGSGEFAMKDDAVLTVQNTATLGFYVQGDGSSGTAHMLLRDDAIVNASRITVSSNFGTLTQTGGEMNINNNGAAAGNFNRIANGAGRQAWYNMTGGSFNVAEITGPGTSILSVGTNRGFGHMNITGTAEVNLAADVEFRLCSNQAGTLGYFGEVNLAGGTFSTPKVTSPDIGGDVHGGVFNFNGGVLKAIQNEPAFMQNLKAVSNPSPGAAYVYPGGAVIDTNTFNITIAEPLLEPVGDGITSISFNPGTQTYVAPPRFVIPGPPTGGLPATAEAFTTLDDNGQINGIILTKPGFGYTSAPTVSFDLGDATATCTIGPVTGGGLTKMGAGTLTLSGVNTYTGTTVVETGTLALGAAGSLSSGVELAAGTIFNTTAQSYVVPTGKTHTLHLDSAGAGSSGKIVAASLDITNATVVVVIDNNTDLDDPVYVLAEYTSLTGGAFSSVTAPPPGYAIDYNYNGENKIAWVVSTNDDYADWDDEYAADLSDKNADFDGDGMSNFQEYAFGLDPTSGASVSPITDTSDLANGFFTYTRRASSGLTYSVWASTDLQDWGIAPVGVSEEVGAPVNGVETVVVELLDPPTGVTFFVRVKAD